MWGKKGKKKWQETWTRGQRFVKTMIAVEMWCCGRWAFHHQTDREGKIWREGKISEVGWECYLAPGLSFRKTKGKSINLAPSHDHFNRVIMFKCYFKLSYEEIKRNLNNTIAFLQEKHDFLAFCMIVIHTAIRWPSAALVSSSSAYWQTVTFSFLQRVQHCWL